MKKSKCLIFTTILLLGGGLAALGLASCDNFLKGSDTKQELERALAYANSDFYKISVNYPEGTGVLKSPAGAIAEKKETDSFSVTFEPFAGYAFVCWQIVDATSGKELQNGDYLTINDLKSSDSLCTFNKKPLDGMKLEVRAIIAERAQIISYSPTTTNAIRDSSIQVLFDRDMDKHSIYYTGDELSKLRADPEVTLLPPIENTRDYYGYKKNNEIYYKNISISNKKTKENLLANFAEPYLAEGMLSIHANKDNPPKDYSQILVSIGKDFFYTYKTFENSEGVSVSLSESKKWLYRVSNSFDDKPMIIKKSGGKDMFSAKLGSVDLTLANDSIPVFDRPGYSTGKQWISKGNLEKTYWNPEGKELTLEFTVQESVEGGGPASTFDIKIEYIADIQYYKNSGDDRLSYTIPVDYLFSEDQEAHFKGTINLEEYLTKKGMYSLSISCPDISNNRLEKTFLIAYDDQIEKPRDLQYLYLYAKPGDKETEFTFRFDKPQSGDVKTEFHAGSITYDESKFRDYQGYYWITIDFASIQGTSTPKFYYKYSDYSNHSSDAEGFNLSKNAINKNTSVSGDSFYMGNYPQSKINSVDSRRLYVFDINNEQIKDGYYDSYKEIFDRWYLDNTTGCFYEESNYNFYKVEPVKWLKKTDNINSKNYYMSDLILDRITNYYECTSDINTDKVLTFLQRKNNEIDLNAPLYNDTCWNQWTEFKDNFPNSSNDKRKKEVSAYAKAKGVYSYNNFGYWYPPQSRIYDIIRSYSLVNEFGKLFDGIVDRDSPDVLNYYDNNNKKQTVSNLGAVPWLKQK